MMHSEISKKSCMKEKNQYTAKRERNKGDFLIMEREGVKIIGEYERKDDRIIREAHYNLLLLVHSIQFFIANLHFFPHLSVSYRLFPLSIRLFFSSCYSLIDFYTIVRIEMINRINNNTQTISTHLESCFNSC